LLVPAPARADSVGLSSAIYQASFVRLSPEREDGHKAGAAESLFSWCKHCVAPDASPFLVSANLSELSSKHGDFDFGFGRHFGGAITFPVPALSSSVSANTTGSAPSITLPSSHPAEDDHAPAAAAAAGGGTVQQASSVAGGVASTGRTVLTKAESLAATPEPATLFLLGTGLVGFAARRGLRRAA
jgi:hypothetical protein